MTELPKDQGNRVRKGKLRAKLSRTKGIAAQKEILQKIVNIDNPPAPPGSGPEQPLTLSQEIARPLKEDDLKTVMEDVLKVTALTGFPVKCTGMAQDSLISGLSRLAKQKGWDMAVMGNWGLISLGVLLTIIQSVPMWIAAYKEKTKEVQVVPPIRPDDSPGSDG